jgi:hypothetical protein
VVQSSATTRTGGRWWQRCRRGQTTDSRGPPGRGGEARGAQTVVVDGEALRGRRWLGDQLFRTLLAGDSGSWLLLHVEQVTAVRFPGLVGDNSGPRWPAIWSRAASKSEAEWRV